MLATDELFGTTGGGGTMRSLSSFFAQCFSRQVPHGDCAVLCGGRYVLFCCILLIPMQPILWSSAFLWASQRMSPSPRTASRTLRSPKVVPLFGSASSCIHTHSLLPCSGTEYINGDAGVLDASNGVDSVVFAVASGNYSFVVTGTTSPRICVEAPLVRISSLSQPHLLLIIRVRTCQLRVLREHVLHRFDSPLSAMDNALTDLRMETVTQAPPSTS